MFTSTTMRCITVTILLPEDLWASVWEALRYNHSRTPTLDTPAAVLVKWSKPPNKNREKGKKTAQKSCKIAVEKGRHPALVQLTLLSHRVEVFFLAE